MPAPYTVWNDSNAKTKALFTIWSRPKRTQIRHPLKSKDALWLHYRVTSAILISGVMLTSVYSYFDSSDSAIQCYADRGIKVPRIVLDRYCWMMSTFTLPKHYNNASGDLAIYPGVGPYAENDPKLKHAYYQWVPLFLFFQLIAFYAPRGVWKYIEGGKFKKLLDSLMPDKEDKDGENKQSTDPVKKKDGEEALPYGRCRKELQPDNIAFANFLERCFKYETDSDLGALATRLKAKPNVEDRLVAIKKMFEKMDEADLGALVKCFQGKIYKPKIVKYLVEKVSYIHVDDLLSFLEKDEGKMQPSKVIDYIMDQGQKQTEKFKPAPSNDYPYGEYRKWDLNYFRCEILSCLNLVLQLWLTNKFLGGQLFQYGWKIFSFPSMEPNQRRDALALVFPTMTKCIFHKFGASGTIMRLDALCVLGINIINEKFFIVLWFWFVLLTILSFGSLFLQTFRLVSPNYRPRYLRNLKLRGLPNDDTKEYQDLMGQMMNEMDPMDWLILYIYTQPRPTDTMEWKAMPNLLLVLRLLFKETICKSLKCYETLY